MNRVTSTTSINANSQATSYLKPALILRRYSFQPKLLLAAFSAMMLIAPLAHSQTESVLYSFPSGSQTNGSAARLTLHNGNLYGTSGGINGYGTVFELSPNGSGGWNQKTLYSFSGGADGSSPGYSYVIFDAAGNLYGTTHLGGEFNRGVVFELSPSGSGWKETVLHSFDSQYASYPANGLVMGAAGNLFGTTDNCCSGAGKDGAGVFELVRSGSAWTMKMLFAFPAAGFSGLAIDANGDLFGYAYVVAGETSVYELSPSDGSWKKKILYNLTMAQGAGSLNGSPALDQHGNLYGVTEYSPTNSPAGTVFELSPTTTGPWTYKLLYGFTGGTDGGNPNGGPTLDAKGNVYGTTTAGGANSAGTVYELVSDGSGNFTETVLLSFNITDGGFPLAPVILDTAGNLYGTTPSGGANNNGNVFEVTH